MSNTTVPATAEGLPTDVHVRNRIRDLAYEISGLLDRVPMAASLSINPANSPHPAVMLCQHVDEEEAKLDWQSIPDDPWRAAEFHGRKLAEAMAEWPDCMRFQVTIKPHDAEQRLFWMSMPDEETELDQLDACIERWQTASDAFALVCDTDRAVREVACEAEDAAWSELLEFPCRTSKAKERKVGLMVSANRHRLESDHLETLLQSLVL